MSQAQAKVSYNPFSCRLFNHKLSQKLDSWNSQQAAQVILIVQAALVLNHTAAVQASLMTRVNQSQSHKAVQALNRKAVVQPVQALNHKAAVQVQAHGVLHHRLCYNLNQFFQA